MAVNSGEQMNRAVPSAGAVLSGVRKRLTRRAAPSTPGLAPAFLEIALAIGIGALLITVLYALFAPLPAPARLPESLGASTPAQTPTRALTTTPFRIASLEAAPAETAAALSEDLEETSLNLKLYGVYSDGERATAYIEDSRGEQKFYQLDEQVATNVTLERIEADHVILNSGGVRETLTLEGRDPALRQKTSASSASRQSAGLRDGDELGPTKASAALGIGDAVRISVEVAGGGKMRIIVNPGPDRAAFEAAGLKPGDTLVAVNNRRIGGNLVAEAKSLASLPEDKPVSVLVERDGVTVPLEIGAQTREQGPGGDQKDSENG